jgi:hypothetical protein
MSKNDEEEPWKVEVKEMASYDVCPTALTVCIVSSMLIVASNVEHYGP